MTDAEYGEKTEISGIIEKITYCNKQNGYTVCTVKSGREHITVVGSLPFVTVGDNIKFIGSYTVHPVYGKQFSAQMYETVAPKTVAAILRYLSSGIIKGVGPTTAERIVEKFGSDTLDIIQNHPEELQLIKGISHEKAMNISEEYKKQFGIRDLMLLLAPYQVSMEKCIRIFQVLGTKAGEKIKDNPYILCRDEIDFPFEHTEKIAFDLGISPDNEMRLSSGIEYILRKNLLNGHTCLPRKKLVNVAVKMLESDELRIEQICDKMIENMLICTKTVNDSDFLMLPEYFNAEEYIAARLLAGKNYNNSKSFIDELEIDYVENKLSIKFEELQRTAIKNAFSSGVFVLTGGPGTGKTTTLNAIIELFEQRDVNIQLAAPTGRAAKRMTELTGREAKTIHRLLEVEWTGDDGKKFSRNERNPLECEVIIIDEASMIDSLLFESLLRALKISCRIILVGDTDQLPSVSAGNVLNDILASNMYSAVCLKKVFRQAVESTIITNAHAIINGEPSDMSNKNNDFFILHKNNAFDVCNTVLELCEQRLPKAYGFDSLTDIQVLCPSRKAETGTANLNNLLQATLNPKQDGQPQLAYKGVYFRTGDKVMQIKNNYDLQWQRDNGDIGYGVFNGDVGYITLIDIKGGIIKVKFDDRTATYFAENIGELELAYAVTVHKSQGSEFECVILPLFDIPTQLLYRNLLYTAVTRAKKMLVIVGSEAVYNQMAQNDRKTLRYTMLKEFLIENENT
ncbi:MAG: ATP-dependent RecD-like DNA helicase [Acutalibacteraceae bacterium]|nr:ATP-dependent RecD-like DNA helicase [Acutalibacteraceae bacterium]